MPLVFLGALGLLTAWTAASWFWSDSPPLALVEAQRVALYFAAAVACVLAGRRLSLPWLAGGVAVASTFIAVWNLAIRIGGHSQPSDLGASARPVGYANSLALHLRGRPAAASRAAATCACARGTTRRRSRAAEERGRAGRARGRSARLRIRRVSARASCRHRARSLRRRRVAVRAQGPLPRAVLARRGARSTSGAGARLRRGHVPRLVAARPVGACIDARGAFALPRDARGARADRSRVAARCARYSGVARRTVSASRRSPLRSPRTTAQPRSTSTGSSPA